MSTQSPTHGRRLLTVYASAAVLAMLASCAAPPPVDPLIDDAALAELSALVTTDGLAHEPVESRGTVESTYAVVRIAADKTGQVLNDRTVASLRSHLDEVEPATLATVREQVEALGALVALGQDDPHRAAIVANARKVLAQPVGPAELEAAARALEALQRMGESAQGLAPIRLDGLAPQDPRAAWALRLQQLTGQTAGTATWRSAAVEATRQRIAQWAAPAPTAGFWVDARALVGTQDLDEASMRRMYDVARSTRGCSAYPHLFNAGGGADLCDLIVIADAVEATGTEESRKPDSNSWPTP
ncbi:hypothetical protein KILIM_039_00030 [Kineosphaera limosa NBRC 100340]|uniref:DUF4439 domain-containing protein n=1 Tax=Kineosphaera limosa NBRC 100340 TaxID=1184609 RepID=K6XCA0_9MICO|nr:hypothetical protein KILIM_039_00030 [Kineosphaera limosa NBRC 100340]